MARMPRILLVPAFAALLVVSGSVAQADYSFSNVTVNTTAPGVTVTPLSPTAPDTTPSNPVLFNIALSGTPVGTYMFTFTEAITGVGNLAGVNQTFSVVGTLSVYFSSANAIISTFAPSSFTDNATANNTNYTEPLGSSNYSTSNNGTTATLAIGVIPATAVPEPASVVMLGLGLVGSIGYAARRRLARA